MNRSKGDVHDQLPSVDEIKVSHQGSDKSCSCVHNQGCLRSTTYLFLIVLLIGFVLGFVGMTVFLDSEGPLSDSGATDTPDNNNIQETVPQQTFQSRIEATLGAHAMEIFVDSSSSYQAKAIEHMKQEDDVYMTYSDERLKQVYGLLCLYYATNDNGNGWLRASSWQVDYNECQWEGIRCNSLDQVVEIDLSYFGLNGVVPLEITLVEAVLVLRLDNNPGLTGSIPAFLGQMRLLQLSVTGCGYVGEMPEEICQLKDSNPNAILAVDCAFVQCDSFCCNCR